MQGEDILLGVRRGKDEVMIVEYLLLLMREKGESKSEGEERGERG